MTALATLTLLLLGATQLLNSAPATAGQRHLWHSSRNSLAAKSGQAAPPLSEQRVAVPSGVLAWSPLLGIDTASASPAGPNPVQLTRCINDKYSRKNMTWAAAMRDDLAALEVATVMWSAKQRPDVPITLVTQASVDRFPQLYAQCRSWKGPLSVVLYLGLVQESLTKLTTENHETLLRATSNAAKFFAEVEVDPSMCALDMMVVFEIYTEKRAMMLYPINVLRNFARLQARTPVVALVDVDMLISGQLYQDLMNNKDYGKQLAASVKSKTAYVMPAFETYGPMMEAASMADAMVTKTKSELVAAVGRGVIAPFDSKRFPLGHNWTLFDRWYKTGKEYQIKYGYRYEPWTMVDRKVAPWHDVRFRGYGNNKIVHIAHMNATGFKFVVHPQAFIVHRAHKETPVRLRLVASKAKFDKAIASRMPVDKASVYGHTKLMFDAAQQAMGRGSFKPVLDPATSNCLSKLSWWKDSSKQ